jgi:hypothetical protein
VALGNGKSRQAVPALIRALEDDEALVRGHVAWALGQIGANEGIEALQKRLRVEGDATVRQEIEDAIAQAARVPESETAAPGVESSRIPQLQSTEERETQPFRNEVEGFVPLSRHRSAVLRGRVKSHRNDVRERK